MTVGAPQGGRTALQGTRADVLRWSGILEAPHVPAEPLTVVNIAEVKAAHETTDLASNLGRLQDDADHVVWSWNDIWFDPCFRGRNIETVAGAIPAVLEEF